MSHLRTFGCDAYVHIPKEKRSKLDMKSQKCMSLVCLHKNLFIVKYFAPNFANTNVYAKRVGALFVTITLYINDYIIVTNDH